MNISTVIISLMVLQASVKFGDALKCYDCRGRSGNECFSPINETTIRSVDCRYANVAGSHRSSEYECVAYLKRYDKTTTTFVYRHCIVKPDVDFCKTYKESIQLQGYTVEECESCSEDYCNSGQKAKLSFILSTFLILLWKSF